MLHLHVRDTNGAHSLDADTYRHAIDAVRNALGDRLLIQVTTEAAGKFLAPAQMALVRELRPDCVSLAIRELVPTRPASRPPPNSSPGSVRPASSRSSSCTQPPSCAATRHCANVG